jgi:hypothetical protein
VVTHPQIVLLVLAYFYLTSGLIGLTWSRLRRRHDLPASAHPEPAPRPADPH